MVMSSEEPADFIRDSWTHTQEQFPKGSLHLRYTDHHNETRATVRYGLDGALAAQVLMLTLDGVPLFYNGMEVGDATESADPALFEKMPVFWHPGGRKPLRDIYRDLIKLRKTNAAFSNVDVNWVSNSAPGEVVSFLRQDGKDEFLILINLSSRRVAASVGLPDAADFEPVDISGRAKPVDIVLPDFHLTGYGWFIYHRTVPK
jgi:glycosidase